MSQERDIEKSYRLLGERSEKWLRLNSLSYMIVYFGFNVLLYGTFEGGHIYEYGYYIPTIVAFVILLIGVRIQKKAKLLKLSSHEKLFLRFYRIADVLENYLYEKKSKNKKVSISHLQKLSRYISYWITKTTPHAFREVPKSISDSLSSSISLIKENDEEKIQVLIQSLYSIAKKSYEKDPSYSDFIELRDSLKKIIPDSSETATKYSIIMQKFGDLLKSDPRFKFIIIGIGGFVAFISTQYLLPSEMSQFATNVIMGGITLSGFLLYLYDRSTKINSKNKSSSNN